MSPFAAPVRGISRPVAESISETYLLEDSRAVALARRDAGGHGITPQTLGELGVWIGQTLTTRAV